jgi:hypothetical protein
MRRWADMEREAPTPRYFAVIDPLDPERMTYWYRSNEAVEQGGFGPGRGTETRGPPTTATCRMGA